MVPVKDSAEVNFNRNRQIASTGSECAQAHGGAAPSAVAHANGQQVLGGPALGPDPMKCSTFSSGFILKMSLISLSSFVSA